MKFLVAYNGSNESKAALDLAIKHATAFNAKVYIITSMEGGASEKPEDVLRVQDDLDHARSAVEKSGLEFEVHEMVRGLSPGEDLVKFAIDNQIDQIFTGIEKKSKTRKILLGSTAQYIILKGPCPVTTTK